METIAVPSAGEVAVVQFSEIFHELAGGDSLDPQHAAVAVSATPGLLLPRLPDGHPDLQAVWENSTLTPLERPPSPRRPSGQR